MERHIVKIALLAKPSTDSKQFLLQVEWLFCSRNGKPYYQIHMEF